MASALYKLLADMAEEPEKFRQYQNDIESLLSEYDLSEEQKDLIRVGGEENYLRLLRDERSRQFGEFCV
jgi:hypothetical protein